MDVHHDPFPALTPANCGDMLPLQREAIANYFNITGVPRFRRMCMDALAATPLNAAHGVPAELVALSHRASENWTLNPRGPRIACGVVLGGQVHEFANGSSQSQIASFSVPRLDIEDTRDPAEIQAANTEFAVACVRFVRQLIFESIVAGDARDAQ